MAAGDEDKHGEVLAFGYTEQLFEILAKIIRQMVFQRLWERLALESRLPVFCVYLCGVMFRIVGDGALDVPFGAVWFQFVTKYKKQTMF